MDYIDGDPERFLRGGACATTVPTIQVVVPGALRLGAADRRRHRHQPRRRAVGLPQLGQRRHQVERRRQGPVARPGPSQRRSSTARSPTRPSTRRATTSASPTRTTPSGAVAERGRHAPLLRRLHVDVQHHGGADHLQPRGDGVLDPRPGVDRPRPPRRTTCSGRSRRSRRPAAQLIANGVTTRRRAADPAPAASRPLADPAGDRGAGLFAGFEFVRATFAAQEAWRAAAELPRRRARPRAGHLAARAGHPARHRRRPGRRRVLRRPGARRPRSRRSTPAPAPTAGEVGAVEPGTVTAVATAASGTTAWTARDRCVGEHAAAAAACSVSGGRMLARCSPGSPVARPSPPPQHDGAAVWSIC